MGTVADLLSRGDRFEFVTEDMTEEEAEQVKDLLAKLGKSVYRANLPRRRLEDLFLEVVAEHAKDDANSSDSTDNIS